MMNIEEIMQLIPHRYPFLLVDRVTDIVPGESITAIKNVTMNEPFFPGHFPQKPIMPGVLIIEAMAQASAIMVAKFLEGDENRLVYFMTIENAKFRKPVVPGDTLVLNIKKTQNRGSVWKCDGEALVNGQKVTEASFSAMVVDAPK
jgi:3-hydroxyacyl-[acyl-carrier-protein] dehydratase